MTLKKVNIRAAAGRLAARLAALCLLLATVNACSVYDDQSDCPRGLELRFVFDYNMERANAFHSQVDCLTVYVFDGHGNLVQKRTETSQALADESYRMTLDLQPGNYKVVALGGVSCDRNSFHITEPTGRSIDDTGLRMQLPLDSERASDTMLHDLFYGSLDGITMLSDDYRQYTVPLIKDTNTIQLSLQELDAPYSVDVNDYDFSIEADNDLLGHDNSTISNGGTTYRPHSLENRVVGIVNPNSTTVEHDDSQPAQVAYTEFSTSRLMTQNAESSHIVVRKKGESQELIRVPLISYMLMVKSNYNSWIQTDQEFLDRQSQWSFMFFLQSGRWINARIAVNHWILRFNNAQL